MNAATLFLASGIAASGAGAPTASQAFALVHQECPDFHSQTRHFGCKSYSDINEAACAYQVKRGVGWQWDNVYFSTDQHRWFLTDGPEFCPGQKSNSRGR
jgi:hypothetical protein